MLNKINGVSANPEAAQSALAGVLEIANRSRAPIDEVAKGFSRLRGAFDDAHASGNALLAFNETMSKSLRIAGADATDTTRFTRELIHILDSPVGPNGNQVKSLMSMNAMMFRDAAVHVKAANGDVGKFMDMWSKGLLKNEEVMAAVIKSSDAVDAKWAKRLPLISEGWTLVNNALVTVLGTASKETGFGQKMFDSISRIKDLIESTSFGKLVSEVMSTIGDGVNGLTKWLATSDNATQVWEGISGAVLGTLKFVRELGKAMSDAFEKDGYSGAMVVLRELLKTAFEGVAKTLVDANGEELSAT